MEYKEEICRETEGHKMYKEAHNSQTDRKERENQHMAEVPFRLFAAPRERKKPSIDMNQVVHHQDILFICLDTLRYDVAVREEKLGNTPVLNQYGPWEKRQAPGNFTYPSHHAMFAGFLPCAYEGEAFQRMAQGLEREPEGGARCAGCYRLRLEEAAKTAAAHGLEYFTTTLSVSPLKNAQVLGRIGQELAQKYGVKHLPADFKKREGYKRSIVLSREYGLYRQNYCGCLYSKRPAVPASGARADGEEPRNL